MGQVVVILQYILDPAQGVRQILWVRGHRINKGGQCREIPIIKDAYPKPILAFGRVTGRCHLNHNIVAPGAAPVGHGGEVAHPSRGGHGIFWHHPRYEAALAAIVEKPLHRIS
jgi:hypothetical protein